MAQLVCAGETRREHWIFRHSTWDGLLVAGATIHGVLLVSCPSILVIGIGLWWNANTVAHYFVHLPFFSRAWQNRLFSVYLSLLLGVPQRLWRERHLAHHAGVPWKLRYSGQLGLESAIVVAFWASLFLVNRAFLLEIYIPGWGLGLMLCWLHGYYEHYRGTASYYGRLYNLALFNDGWHREHHLNAGRHWRTLPGCKANSGVESAWPALLRFLEPITLEGLERVVLRCPKLQGWILRTHRTALQRALAKIPTPDRIGVVGGGLFPRTPLIMRELFPSAELWVIDSNKANLLCGEEWLGMDFCYWHWRYDGEAKVLFDLVTIPLAYKGDRKRLYAAPPARVTVIHDWIWRRHGSGFIISWFLMKRVNVVTR